MFEDIQELRQDAEELQRTFSGQQDPSAEYQGQDSAGAVRVTVRGDGRVGDVEIDRDWRDSVGVPGLGAAVVEAVTAASTRRLTAWGTAVAEEQAGPDAVPDAGQQRDTPRPRTATPADDAATRETLQQVVSMLEGVEHDLDAMERRVTQRAQQEVVGRGPSNMVTVRMVGAGQVTHVEIHSRFLQQAHERRISQELRGAFDAAYDKVGKLDLDGLLGGGDLAALHALGSDPNALLRKLGFDPR